MPVANTKEKFVIGFGKKFALLTWDGISEDPTSVEPLIEIDSGLETRFNDGKVDPQGNCSRLTLILYLNLFFNHFRHNVHVRLCSVSFN